jgi:hypothetical protein
MSPAASRTKQARNTTAPTRSGRDMARADTARRQGREPQHMNRTAVFVMFAFIGCVIAFASALPAARSARSATAIDLVAADRSGEVPLHWVARAVSEMPFLLPGGR